MVGRARKRTRSSEEEDPDFAPGHIHTKRANESRRHVLPLSTEVRQTERQTDKRTQNDEIQ